MNINKNIWRPLILGASMLFVFGCTVPGIRIATDATLSPQMTYAAAQLRSRLQMSGYTIINSKYAKNVIRLCEVTDSGLPHEGFMLSHNGKNVTITGNDPSGVIYGVNKLMEYVQQNGYDQIPSFVKDAPEMVLRGACVGLQKTILLPGHSLYEYPYTFENFPWFYNKELWICYLDMLAANNMNVVYLWNGHPFASLVKLKDYPFAVEVDDATLKRNKEMYSFLTTEAKRRGIRVIQMFYNIIVSKPFAEHYGIKTQDRNRPIIPLVSDYTRKSIATFIEEYPNVGLMLCLGEAMDTYDDDVEWMTKTIIPGVKDGLKVLGRTDEPPIILRAHDTDCPRVLKAALPLYHNIYTVNKYTGESLTTYEPGGPWSQTDSILSKIAPLHISNVHILANLEPWRWSSPTFVEKVVQAMHRVKGENGLHLYPQSSYWDWPYTADKLPNGKRELQIDRDWMWYAAWGRYAWNCYRTNDSFYWNKRLANYYGTDVNTAKNILEAYEQSGEIAPKLIRRFGITEGNRQTLLLGMTMSQLVNPYKYTIWPGFYESCGPQGEKLVEYVEKEWKHQKHVGELPLDIIAQCVIHGDSAVAAIDRASSYIKVNRAEFVRLQNDMHCYSEYAEFFSDKVKAAKLVLDYQWGKDLSNLDKAVPLLESSLNHYKNLVFLTKDTYFYANSMQTGQRRIPVGGDNGKNKTWAELEPYYKKELKNLKSNIALLKSKSQVGIEKKYATLVPATVQLEGDYNTVVLEEGVSLFSNRKEVVDGITSELKGLKAFVFDSDKQCNNGTTIEFETLKPVSLLVGYFRDDQKKFARAPQLEMDASANDYGQADPVITNAVRIGGLALVNIHVYSFAPGRHKLFLPKGLLLVMGFTSSEIESHNAGLAGGNESVDWLFY
jgi:hypothetical protein